MCLNYMLSVIPPHWSVAFYVLWISHRASITKDPFYDLVSVRKKKVIKQTAEDWPQHVRFQWDTRLEVTDRAVNRSTGPKVYTLLAALCIAEQEVKQSRPFLLCSFCETKTGPAFFIYNQLPKEGTGEGRLDILVLL